MDISSITDLTTLKAMAYDEIAKVEQSQANLKLLNQQIQTVLGGIAAVAANPKALAEQEQLPLGADLAGSENAPTNGSADAPTDEPAAPAE